MFLIENKRYFNTFDALRFLAFLKVFIFHIPVFGFPVFDFLKNGGGAAVSFFFSLSGFLITYLILAEKEFTGTFNLKAFYVRRILRIWPLYYFMLLFAFSTPYILSVISMQDNKEGYDPNWLMSLLFLENYKMIFTGTFPNVSPLSVMWSLCVEEHFYIIWGILFYFIAIRNVHWIIIGSILIANSARFFFYLNGWSFLDVFTNVDYFAYGAVPAILLIRKKEIVHAFLNHISSISKVCILIACILMFLLLPNFDIQFKSLFEPAVLGIIFLIILSLIVFEENLFMISKQNILSKLGIYTYSLYLTHTIIINLFVKIFEKEHVSLNHPFQIGVFVTVCLLVTIVISMITYYFIEKPFLKIKSHT